MVRSKRNPPSKVVEILKKFVASTEKHNLSFFNMPVEVACYVGGARSKGFATLRNVSKLQFFDKIGYAKAVGFRFYSAI